MMTVMDLPFPLSPSEPSAWRHEGEAVVGVAGAHTDIYTDPGGAAPIANAPTLLGLPPAGDFQLAARVTVDFRATYDAGVLLIWAGDRHWAKFCFEFSPDAEPMVVSVVNRGTSDDSNAYTVADRTIWLRVSRIDNAYAFHASGDGSRWRLVRFFHLSDEIAAHQVGLEAQSPTGEGCTVTFDQVTFVPQRLADLRDGS
jgi:regulation of enolase protein 1 (concanavalin A-like superfamily)